MVHVDQPDVELARVSAARRARRPRTRGTRSPAVLRSSSEPVAVVRVLGRARPAAGRARTQSARPPSGRRKPSTCSVSALGIGARYALAVAGDERARRRRARVIARHALAERRAEQHVVARGAVPPRERARSPPRRRSAPRRGPTARTRRRAAGAGTPRRLRAARRQRGQQQRPRQRAHRAARDARAPAQRLQALDGLVQGFVVGMLLERLVPDALGLVALARAPTAPRPGARRSRASGRPA